MTEHLTPSALLDRLDQHRPTDAHLARLWDAHARDTTLIRATRHEAPRLTTIGPSGRRRVMVRLAAASIAAAAGIGVFAVAGPPGAVPTATASPLQRLAAAAQAAPRVGALAGAYAYLDSTHRQVGHGAQEGGVTVASETSRQQRWIAPDGRTWTVTTLSGGETRAFARCAADQADAHVVGTSAWVAGLPLDPGALLTSLRSYWTGQLGPKATVKGTVDDQVFATLTELLRPGAAGPDARVAGIGALERLDGVTTATTTVGGRQLLEVRFASTGARSGVSQRMLFDPTTSLLAHSEWLAPDLDAIGDYAAEEPVAALPATLATAEVLCNDANGTQTARADTPAGSKG